MPFLSDQEVFSHCREGAFFTTERDGRVVLCTVQGRDLGQVDRELFERLNASGRLKAMRVVGLQALRYIEERQSSASGAP